MSDGDVHKQRCCSCCYFPKEEIGYCRNPTEIRQFGKWVNETTVHGVVHVFKGTSKWRRVVWTVVFLGAFAGLLYNIIDRALFLHSEPSQTSLRFDTAFPGGIAFPAVTLCNLEQISRSYADENNLTSFLEYLWTVFPYEQGFACSENSVDASKTLQDLYLEGGPQADVFLERCSFGRTVFECAQHFVPVMTQIGLCYTFNGNLSLDGRMVNSTGQWHGLRVVMNITAGALLPNSIGDQGVKVAIHPRGVPPEPDETGIAVPPGRNAFVSLEARSFTDMSSKSQCGSVDLPFFASSNYSFPACRQNHLLSAVQSDCSCLDPLTGVYRNVSTEFADTPECTVADFCCVAEHYLMPNANSCPASCNSNSFEATVSYSKFPSNFTASEIALFRTTDPTTIENDLVSVNIYFGNLLTQVTVVSNSYGAVAFLSDLGGQMGLFLGASVISAIEIVMFLSDEIRACLSPKDWERVKKKDLEGDKAILSAENSEALEMKAVNLEHAT